MRFAWKERIVLAVLAMVLFVGSEALAQDVCIQFTPTAAGQPGVWKGVVNTLLISSDGRVINVGPAVRVFGFVGRHRIGVGSGARERITEGTLWLRPPTETTSARFDMTFRTNLGEPNPGLPGGSTGAGFPDQTTAGDLIGRAIVNTSGSAGSLTLFETRGIQNPVDENHGGHVTNVGLRVVPCSTIPSTPGIGADN